MNQRTIYETIVMKYNKEHPVPNNTPNRQANIYAVKWTVKIWKRQFISMRNLFNPQGWK